MTASNNENPHSYLEYSMLLETNQNSITFGFVTLGRVNILRLLQSCMGKWLEWRTSSNFHGTSRERERVGCTINSWTACRHFTTGLSWTLLG